MSTVAKAERTSLSRWLGMALQMMMVSSLILGFLAGTAQANCAREVSFGTLDRVNGCSRLGAQHSVALPSPNSRRVPHRAELYVNTAWSRANGDIWGLYFAVPVAGTLGNDGVALAAGNLELSAFYRWSSPTWGALARIGVAGLTASETATGLYVNLVNASHRLTDFLTNIPYAEVMRASFSTAATFGPVMARLDIGLDAAFARPNAVGAARINFGLGVNTGPLWLTAEMVNTGALLGSGDVAAHAFHTVAVGARWREGWLKPFFSLASPLDSNVWGTWGVVQATLGVELTTKQILTVSDGGS